MLTTKLLAYLAVLVGTMLKFIVGPLAGFSYRLSFIETWVFTVMGMMTSVLVVLVVGTPFRKWLVNKFAKHQRRFTPRKRMIVRVWKNYGLVGIAALTPLLLTPLGGSLIAVALGSKPRQVLMYMAVSAVFWGGVLTAIVYLFGQQLSNLLS